GIDANFFALGGDSLAATQLAHRIRQVTGAHVPVSLTFEAPTIAAMAERVAAASSLPAAGDVDRILIHDEANRHQPFPLTDIQQAYYFGRTAGFELGNVACHLYLEFASEMRDVEGLNRAWCRLIERHDMLRAVVDKDGRQRVLEDVPAYGFLLRDFAALEPA